MRRWRHAHACLKAWFGLFVSVGFLGPGSALAQARDRPPTVPPDFVATPVGYFHRSCIFRVGEDEAVRQDYIEKLDGTRRAFGRCARPSFDLAGNPRDLSNAPTATGWLASSQMWSAPLEWISATWTVPPPPVVVGSQVIYLFPGLVPGYNSYILQPVLAWNGEAALGQRWAIYSWDCCTLGNTFHSDPVPVEPGETIAGFVWGTGCDQQTGICSDWQVRTSGQYASSTVPSFPPGSVGQALPLAVGGALEVRNLDSCNQLPPVSAYTFSNTSVRQVGGATISPTWAPHVDSTTPACVSSVGVSSSTTTIYRTCESGLTLCAGVCVDLASDWRNCGACGRSCPYGCTQGQCNTEPPGGCPVGTIDCCGDGSCVKPSVCAKIGCL